MLLLLGFAFIAGVITILSPCILPLLPIVLSGSATGGHRKPLGIIIGFVTSFTFFTLLLSTVVKATGITPATLRLGAVVVILGFGLSLVFVRFQTLTKKLFDWLPSARPHQTTSEGLVSGILLGLSLGLVWAPCVGPILASVMTLALSHTVTWQTLTITLAYSLGTALPMLIITYSGRQLLQRVPWLMTRSETIQKGFGIVMIGMAVALFFNLDRAFQTYILASFPEYETRLTRFEANDLVKLQLERVLAE